MGAALWLFILLFFIPTALFGAGVQMLIVLYLLALNLLAGYLFWKERTLGGLGRKSVALIYLASGVFFFSFLIDPVKIDTAPIERFNTLAAWRETLTPKPSLHPELSGTPIDQQNIDQRGGFAKRPWLEGLVEDIVRQPEEPR